MCVCVCVACVSVWSWSALQFALQDLKIALANTPSVHPLFVLYCIVYYMKSVLGGGGALWIDVSGRSWEMGFHRISSCSIRAHLNGIWTSRAVGLIAWAICVAVCVHFLGIRILQV